jgi:hypothetical protein
MRTARLVVSLVLLGSLTTAAHAAARCETTLEQTFSYLRGKGALPDDVKMASDLATLDSLDVGDDNVTDDELVYLCPLVSLRYLGLYNDGFANSLTGKTLDRLGTLVNLETLDLDSNRIAARELWRLAPLQKLQNLRLYNNPLGSEGLEALLLLPRLEFVLLQADGFTDDDLPQLTALALHPSLKQLELTGNSITDDGMVFLSTLRLESLDLLGNQLRTGAGLRYLALMPNLSRLSIANFPPYSGNVNRIDAANLRWLRHAEKLRSLNLALLGLHDTDLAYVAELKQLSAINLLGDPIPLMGCACCCSSIICKN